MGNPSVRFDEGRERVDHWLCASQSNRSRLLYKPFVLDHDRVLADARQPTQAKLLEQAPLLDGLDQARPLVSMHFYRRSDNRFRHTSVRVLVVEGQLVTTVVF